MVRSKNIAVIHWKAFYVLLENQTKALRSGKKIEFLWRKKFHIAVLYQQELYFLCRHISWIYSEINSLPRSLQSKLTRDRVDYNIVVVMNILSRKSAADGLHLGFLLFSSIIVIRPCTLKRAFFWKLDFQSNTICRLLNFRYTSLFAYSGLLALRAIWLGAEKRDRPSDRRKIFIYSGFDSIMPLKDSKVSESNFDNWCGESFWKNKFLILSEPSSGAVSPS